MLACMTCLCWVRRKRRRCADQVQASMDSSARLPFFSAFQALSLAGLSFLRASSDCFCPLSRNSSAHRHITMGEGSWAPHLRIGTLNSLKVQIQYFLRTQERRARGRTNLRSFCQASAKLLPRFCQGCVSAPHQGGYRDAYHWLDNPIYRLLKSQESYS